MEEKLAIFIQARYSSKRYPGKILKKLGKTSYLEFLIKRLKKSKYKLKIYVLSTLDPKNNLIKKICKKNSATFFTGPENDVLLRYYLAYKKYRPKNIVRITSDCPFIDYKMLDKMIELHIKKNSDYTTNDLPSTFPDGLDIEIFKSKFLKLSIKKIKSNSKDREHVTTYLRNNKEIKRFSFKFHEDYSFLRLTLDEKDDEVVLKNIYQYFKRKKKNNFTFNDIIKLYKRNKELFVTNSDINNNEGKTMSTGYKTWKRAKQIIPGGTMLFSKNPDLFLPNKWPSYFIKSKGCEIWDLDNIKYKDLSFMGVGTNSLGYSHPYVEKKVIEAVKKGTMTTLNSVEEINLADRLIDLHPWGEMVRFTRSGGEANAVAIRIGRAYSGKDKVAICGYHGWHDWYLSTNIGGKNKLENHLMNKVPYKGVPYNLKDTIFPFEYNNFVELKKIVNRHNIGVIKMEVQRSDEPKNNFLHKVRKLADEKNIILIFDECTSGFREAYGGLHKFYKVNPDMAIFGKALGNGYAINAIVGKKPIMEACNSTFISSTFWTERVGPVAALATLEAMEKVKSWKTITKIGKNLKKNWKKISSSNKLDIKVGGINAIPFFSFSSKNNFVYKTFISQEMLKNNIMASNVVYCSTSHTEKILNKYYDLLNDLFYKINIYEKKGIDKSEFLESEVCKSGIREKVN